jgi:hypothetical protein
MRKLIIRLVIGIVVLVIVGVILAWVFIDRIAKTAIEKGGSYALGVETTVRSVSVSPLSGRVGLEGLKVANPEGFSSPHLMESGTFELEARPGSLLSDTIEVRKFELDGLDVHLEQKAGGSNVTKVMENLEKLSGEPDETKEDEGGGTKVKVDRLLIRNVVAHVHLPGLAGGSLDLPPIKVPTIDLEGVTSDNADGLLLSELSGRIVTAVLAAIVKAGEGVIPTAFLNNLAGDVAAAGQALGSGAQALVEQVGGKVHGLVEEAGRLGEDLRAATTRAVGEGPGRLLEGAKKALGGAGKATTRRARGLLEGILGGGNDDEEE